MSDTYLTSSFKDKDRVKALGARWDPAKRQWYVPDGLVLTPFAEWLPVGGATPPSQSTALISPEMDQGGSRSLSAAPRGIPLSQLLSGVAAAVSQAFRAGVWTLVEVVDTRVRNGHVYLEISERDARGVVVAKASAAIWANTASRILPEFENATGAQIGPGIKLLVRAKPVFKPQFGFSVEIDGIDPDYTLGDLEARKREIRERLQREGLFELNRRLPSPWDYNRVLVVAPEGGAGLGDFQAEASRLESLGICQFLYIHSRFQGDGAASEIRMELLGALERLSRDGVELDAVVIIRGGGAINDMAWLNDYALVRAVCELEVPLLSGIGHERDNTVLDEVANIRYDTPSKVIGGIERVILQRVREAKGLYADVIRDAARAMDTAGRTVGQSFTAIESGARQKLARSRTEASELLSDVKLQAAQTIRIASENTERQMNEVRRLATDQIALAKREVPTRLAEIRADARQTLQTARARIEGERGFVLERGVADLRYMKDATARTFEDTATLAQKTLTDARTKTQALMREIAGQGPAKTLGRGFALVRGQNGHAVTSAASPEAEITIQFRDGLRAARLQPKDKP
ncbi:exodeoxyribonuclease VII large subunit [Acidovorax sp. NPDC077693]|uniref:exodeoxyribonuclease VII large subunit n=1 Tax=unclassified Acidovorax TaxID=2684926 RepID=UPI0037C945C3